MITINAGYRLRASAQLKHPDAKTLFVYNIAALSEALNSIINWYNEPTTYTNLEEAIKTLTDLFGYIPYNKDVYRVFPIPQSIYDKLKAGDTKRVKTATRPIQSWTTSAANAKSFYQLIMSRSKDHYGIFKLLSPGLELMNQHWLSLVIAYMVQAYEEFIPNHSITLNIMRTLERCERTMATYVEEDEVIMKLPETSKVKLIEYMS